MKLFSVIKKSFKEQIRHFWLFLLTITMAPIFIFIYYLMLEVSSPTYTLVIINKDKGLLIEGKETNYGDSLLATGINTLQDNPEIPFKLKIVDDRQIAVKMLKDRSGDALVVIPGDFTENIYKASESEDFNSINIEISGDLTSMSYLVTAVYANDLLNNIIKKLANIKSPLKINEISMGFSGSISDFEMVVPGLLILSIIMLMFSASIALISEVENKTIIRLKLTRVTPLEYICGVSFIQVIVGFISILLTLITAVGLGFTFKGSFFIFIFIALLTSISIIAFSLVVAAFTKSANEVLVAGNFPLFLFMFFTGAAFPIKGKALFTIAGYPFTIQGLLSPTHSISALKKVMIFDSGIGDILPEITLLFILTTLYFILGAVFFKRRHMKVE